MKHFIITALCLISNIAMCAMIMVGALGGTVDPPEAGPDHVSYGTEPVPVMFDAAPSPQPVVINASSTPVSKPAATNPSLDDLWHAVCIVESSGDPRAHRTIDNEDSRGIAQIRAIMVKDVNRIAGYQKYVHNDAWDVTKSREMFEIFAHHYFPDGSFEQIARAWNGGPAGPRKESTIVYWNKIQRHL